jgi:hypothetical protein
MCRISSTGKMFGADGLHSSCEVAKKYGNCNWYSDIYIMTIKVRCDGIGDKGINSDKYIHCVGQNVH